jgi:RNA polymerase sigma-70 factor (ECF subfamily)
VVAVQRELVERAIGGDFEAFSCLVRAATSHQYAIATLILRDGDRAQDAVQEALVSAWKGMSALRDPDAWDAWLHRLTVRACFQAARHERRRELVEVHVVPDQVAGAQDVSMALGDRDRLERSLALLPIDQRAVIVLHFYVGLPLTVAADVLDIPHGTAKSRLHRGLAAMRSDLHAEPEATRKPVPERVA